MDVHCQSFSDLELFLAVARIISSYSYKVLAIASKSSSYM